ncbi:MAG: SMI1/KNR4 family protein [Pirellulales bacterium]
MATHTNHVVPAFNFDDALQHTSDERVRLCVDNVRDRLFRGELWCCFDIPPVPSSGATEEELQRLESNLGVTLPGEYRLFLAHWRYLDLGFGRRIWGFDHQGVSIGCPWTSDSHMVGTRYLVFADYWAYADGDQLMFDLSNTRQEVTAYLHEHGPLLEAFAPSFSLALWRMVFEELDA